MERWARSPRTAASSCVEDAAQAQGAARRPLAPAASAPSAATSFYPGKNLGAYGDAGRRAHASDEIAASACGALRNYGSEVKYQHPEPGFNSRLDTLQAVVLTREAEPPARLERRAPARRPQRYDELLAGIPGVRCRRRSPATSTSGTSTWCACRGATRCCARLQAAGIGAGVHYPVPIHLHGAFRHLGHRAGDFPVAERAAARDPLAADLRRDHGGAAGARRRRAAAGARLMPRGKDVFVHERALCEIRRCRAAHAHLGLRHVMAGAVVGADCNVGDHAFIENGAGVATA